MTAESAPDFVALVEYLEHFDDECSDDGEGYCLIHPGGVFNTLEEDCSEITRGAA